MPYNPTFSICGANQSVSSFGENGSNWASFTIRPKSASLTGGQISGGTISITVNGATTNIALSGINNLTFGKFWTQEWS